MFSHCGILQFAVMIKAVSGGGGKGMRAVYDSASFIEALDSCRREAERSFGDKNVLIEKLGPNPNPAIILS